jgi:hypothetical protein
MWRVLLAVYIFAFVGAALFNALLMVVSPQSWFRLPGWIRLSGSLTEKSYSSGWGVIQVRVLGLILLAAFAWVAYHLK